MSGIAAIYFRDRSIPPKRSLEGFVASLKSHGKEYQKLAIYGPVALVYAHASPGDGDGDEQPMEGGDGRFVLLFDGWVSNRAELAAKLSISPARLVGKSDSWIVMRGWERWGSSLPEHLDGDFALIVWDCSDQKLFAARSRVGYYPLSLHCRPDRVIVSSSVHGLFAFGDVERRINPAVIARSLSNIAYAGNEGMYEGVQHVPLAHMVTVGRAYITFERYWQLDHQAPFVRLKSDHEYVEATRELLDRAVRARMATPGKVACELTGGLDSSAVAITALQFVDGNERLPAFTYVPEEGWDGRVGVGYYGDEGPYVREIVAMHPRLGSNFIRHSGQSWDFCLNDFLAVGAAVPLLPRYLNIRHQIFRQAREMGATVLLGGGMGNLSLSWDGSEVFAAYLRERRLVALFRELMATAPSPIAFARAIVSRVALPLGPDWLWRLYRLVKHHRSSDPGLTGFSFLRPEVVQKFDLQRELASEFLEQRPTGDYREFRARYLAPNNNYVAAEMMNSVRALYGIDFRDPLGDRHLVEWCLRVPPDQYWRNGVPRWLARRVMAGRLPNSILSNRMRGEPEADWHMQMSRQLPQLREQVDILCSDPDVSELIDTQRLRRSLDEWPARTPNGRNDNQMYRLSGALPYAVAVGRFIRWTKGANS
ncbi:MAG: hypothetical protein JNM89_03830 [Hyphomicrobiaceae bacterium]|nr:hypothetical protein [Hyphomicrobiaceae bacterium]